MAECDQALDQDEQKADATGGDSAEGKASQREEHDAPAGSTDDDSSSEDGGGEGEGQSEEHQKAQAKEEETQAAREKIKEMEEGEPRKDLEDWPDDAAKYETFGGPEGEHGYHEGPAQGKLGPSSLRHHEDGRVEIAGEEVGDPDKYKGDPIPGGPTDPGASQDLTTEKIRDKQGRDLESEDGDGDSDSDDSDSEDSEDSDSESKSESESESKSESEES